MLSGEGRLKPTRLKEGREGFLRARPSGIDYWCLRCLPPAASRHDSCFLRGGFSDERSSRSIGSVPMRQQGTHYCWHT